jgi:hypothetical protein
MAEIERNSPRQMVALGSCGGVTPVTNHKDHGSFDAGNQTTSGECMPMTISTGLAMSWHEWHKHDAVALAELVRAGQVTPKELCAQAAEAVTRIDPQIEAVARAL